MELRRVACALEELAGHTALAGHGGDRFGRIATAKLPSALRRRVVDAYRFVWDSDGWPVARPLTGALGPVLNQVQGWRAAERDLAAGKVVVLDNFFSVEVLAELQRYSKVTGAFRTVRAGFLGAFPGDGLSHPFIAACARDLEKRMPNTVGHHPLGLFWLFKYTEQAPKGIGLHVDAAAVNVNIWLTPDEHCLEGGGLEIYEHVPKSYGVRTERDNREFASVGEEEALVASLGPPVRVAYKCNRAVIFDSDAYHRSERARFAVGYEKHRVNLTLLFGDRRVRGHLAAEHAAHGCYAAAPTAERPGSGAAGPAPLAAQNIWDIFD